MQLYFLQVTKRELLDDRSSAAPGRQPEAGAGAGSDHPRHGSCSDVPWVLACIGLVHCNDGVLILGVSRFQPSSMRLG